MLLIARNGFLQALQVVSSIVLARAITPNDYGQFAIAATLVGFARSVGDLGLSQSLIVDSEIAEEDLRTCSAIVLLTAIFVGTLVAVIGVGINLGVLSGQASATLTAVFAGTVVVDAFRLGPIVRLTRGLRFREIAVATTVETLASYLAQVVLLLCGLGVWALVAAAYARSIAGVVTYAKLGGPIPWPRFGGHVRALVKDGLPYQGPLVLSGALGSIFPVIVATYLSAHGLGLWAWSTILAVPVVQALTTVQSVLLPSLARLYGQYRARFLEACDRSARLISLLAAAAAATLFGLSPEVITEIFGARWTAATGAVQVTLLGIVPLAVLQFLSAILASRGQAGVRFRCAIIASAVTLLLVYPLMRMAGVTGAAIASAVVGPTVDAALLARYAEVPLRRAGFNAIAALIPIGIISVLVGRAAKTPFTLGLASVGTGAAAVAVVWLIDRPVLRYASSLVRSPRRDRSTAGAS